MGDRMVEFLTRRGAAFGLGSLAMTPASRNEIAAAHALGSLERNGGGRLGVFVLDTASGRVLAHRADERFLMCSTFKTLAVAQVLGRVDAGRERLDRRIAYGERDLLDYAPVTRAHVGDGSMTVEALCAAAIEASDNTAANLLLATLGGPAGVTRYVRGLGDTVTRLDRPEPDANRPQGDLDTTTPRAMAGSVRRLLLGDVLRPASRQRIEGWMRTSNRGLARLRAGLPHDWIVGDKAGTGAHECNDVAIARRPGRAPVIMAAYYVAGRTAEDRESILHEVGMVIGAWSQG